MQNSDTITLLKPFANTHYTVLATQEVNATDVNYQYAAKVRIKTTTSVAIYTNSPTRDWMAFGISN